MRASSRLPMQQHVRATSQSTTDQTLTIVTLGAVSPGLLAARSETPMPILDEARLPDPVVVGGVEKQK